MKTFFSTYVYEGTGGGGNRITNNLDLAGEGGLVWIKDRDEVNEHVLTDTVRGTTKSIYSNTSGPEETVANGLTSFHSDGFTVDSLGKVNGSGKSYASWTFRKAPKFFDIAEVTKSSGSDATASFSDLEILGMVAVKRTDNTGSWYVWHGSLTAGKLLYLEQTAAEATLGHITVSGTTVTLEDSVIADGTYIIYAWAHDTADDGLIACGSYTGNGAIDGPEIDLGWEPQYLIAKPASTTGEWAILDNMRGIVSGGNDAALWADASSSENTTNILFDLTPTGFKCSSATYNASGQTYIYMAIRRGPMRTPTDATKVFAIDQATGSVPTFISGFPVDMGIYMSTTGTAATAANRLTGPGQLYTSLTNAEATSTDKLFDCQNGWYDGAAAPSHYYSWMLRRAPGFMDVVACKSAITGGTISNQAHNLGVVPEMAIAKCRSTTGNWETYHKDLGGDQRIVLNDSMAAQGYSGYASVSASQFSFTGPISNDQSYLCLLFATLAGISKVGSYTGNGSSQTIDCGFSAGARFILIKRTDDTGDWFLWDSLRGIVAGNDPHLSLNTTAAEVTTDDSIDPDASGFIVNQVAATNINVNTAEYIFLAIA